MKHVTNSKENIRVLLNGEGKTYFFYSSSFSDLTAYYKPDQRIHNCFPSTADSGFTFAAFQLRSLGILPFGASNTITAAVTFVTAPGGDPNDFSSVKFPWGYSKEADC
jgi:hypothetical protein